MPHKPPMVDVELKAWQIEEIGRGLRRRVEGLDDAAHRWNAVGNDEAAYCARNILDQVEELLRIFERARKVVVTTEEKV